ncbi:MAG TPA: glycosyltransferase [Clostridiaceae bacterium]|nr:glycosyltransferase [Clostridiaceae bacterium]
MKFSVLMTVYNGEKPNSLELAIKSLLWQTILPNQIVIVKDGILSKELNDIIDKYAKENSGLFTIVQLNENKGIGMAAKIGLEYCEHEFVARLDSDDISLPNRFERQLEFMKKNIDVSVVGTWTGEFEGNYTNIVSVRKPAEKMEDIIKKSKRISPLTNTSTMFKKEHVLLSGGYIDLKFGEDYHLWAKMITNGYKIANIPEILVLVDVSNKYKKRGGIAMIKQQVKLQSLFLGMGFINIFDFFINTFIRVVLTLVPNTFRRLIYKNILRRLNNQDLNNIDFSFFNQQK